jgi:NAD(P)-dependent dehydrogenase (short-subunit alcohol dehydrogenase family)
MSNMQGKICVVTGANTGIGKVVARELARAGATVVMACRNEERGRAAREELVRATGNERVEVMQVDLASKASVRAFAKAFTAKYPRLDVLVNNAGAWWMERQVSPDGLEMQWATNVLGPHLLTSLLVEPLKAARGRLINVASTAAGGLDLEDVHFERRGYSGVKAYSATKQANRMLTWAWAERLKADGITANALSPGLVNTELNRSVGGIFKALFTLTKLFAKTPEQGADTIVWLASSPEVAGVTGKFFEDRKEKPCKFREPAHVSRLWDVCQAQLN